MHFGRRTGVPRTATQRRASARPSVLAALAALLVLALATGLARAATPRLEGQINDYTGVLDASEGEITAALDDLETRAGIELWVLFVDTTQPQTAREFAFQTAEANSMGVNDALLVVALDDRTDFIWLSDGLTEVSDAELDTVISQRLEPNLGEGDFAGAVVAAADGLADAAVAVAPPPPDAPAPTVPEGGGSILPLLGVVLLVIGLFLVVRWVMAWRARRGEAEERDRRTGELAKRANALLLQADDATSEAEQELGFAEAQLTPAEVQPFRDALAGARTEIAAAFAVRQRLDDSTPEDPQTREQLLNQLVAHAQKSLDPLAAQRQRISEIRAMERAAPEILAVLPARINDLEARLPDAEAQLERLGRFAESTTAPVAGNLIEVQKRLSAARQGVEAGSGALASGDPQTAGRSARLAQEATTEADQLLAAIAHLEQNVSASAARVDGVLREAENSVDAARLALTRVETAPAEHQERLRLAERSLNEARTSAVAQRPDPITAERLAHEADKLSDEVLAAAHAESERFARAAATARGALATAEGAYSQALDYVTSRRSAMGRRARTRLVEAERHLAEARVLVDSDPVTAVQAARRAESLSLEAISYGQSDLAQYDMWGGGGYSRGGGGSDLPMVILGGILGGMLSGGGRSGGAGWGGTPWGRSGGGFGGFGGRGGGGGFSLPGGGGRGAGGRW